MKIFEKNNQILIS